MHRSNRILLRIRTLWIIPAVAAAILLGAAPSRAQDATAASTHAPETTVTLEQLIEQSSVEERLWAANYCLEQAAIHPAEQRIKLYVASLRFLDAVPSGHAALPRALKLRAQVLRRLRQDSEVLALLANPAPTAPTTSAATSGSSDSWPRTAPSRSPSTSADATRPPDEIRPAPPQRRTYSAPSPPTTSGYGYPCAENGSCYGDPSTLTGAPKTIHVQGYYRRDGTYVRGHYRSRGRHR